MRFRRSRSWKSGRALLLAVSMIVFALLGLRYWTLVIGGYSAPRCRPQVCSRFGDIGSPGPSALAKRTL